MAKRRNFNKRQCSKCGGKIGVIKRDRRKGIGLDLLGCVAGIHLNWSYTTGYDLSDFPLRKKKAA